MFPQAHADWEENFQDLSGWCHTPTSRNVKGLYGVTTDELNTPMIELEKEEFHFNIDLSSSTPKFDAELENIWELASPPDLIDPYSPSIIGSKPAEDTMGSEDSEFPTFDYYNKKNNVFISDNQNDDFVVKRVCAAPLALVEGKMQEKEVLAANTLNTPDIVRMIMEFPVKNDNLAVVTNITDETQAYNLQPPLPEIVEDGFDLLSFIVDDCPKSNLSWNVNDKRSANVEQEKKMLSPLTTIAEEDLHSYPSTSTEADDAITSQRSVTIKEEGRWDVEDDEEQDETYLPNKRVHKQKRCSSRKRPSTELPLVLPSKRNRRSGSTVSTCSDVTTQSISSSSKYRELRDRNNEASKKSRQTRKNRDKEMTKECMHMEKINRKLKTKATEMEALVKKLRQALLTAVAKNKK